MMKRSLSLFMVVLVAAWASAYDFGAYTPETFSYDDEYTGGMIVRHGAKALIYYAINPDGKSVTIVEGPTTYKCTYVQIPEKVTDPDTGKSYTVTTVGASAFLRAEMEEILLPNSVEEIQDDAFQNCSVTKVVFPTGLKHIRDGAFSGAWRLKAVILHEGVQTIGEGAFSTCGGPSWYSCSSDLESVKLPESVSTIGRNAFYNDISLTSINLPMNLKEIEEDLFHGCTSLTQITLPTELEKICRSAFSDAALFCISFPSKLKEIDEYAFRGNLFDTLTLPSTLQIVQEFAFSHCLSLTEVSVDFKMDELADNLFSHCEQLQKVTINSNITQIGEGVFEYCKQLVKVSLPNTLTDIGSSAFYGCERLSSISLPDNVVFIGSSAFAETGLVRFTFPAKLSTISNVLFRNCTKLTSITVPSTISEINANAFQGCSSLNTVSLPETITKLPDCCFGGCSALTAINIPSKVTKIGESCFSGCKSLKAISLPDALEDIEGSCFSECSALTAINIPSKVTTIGESCFYGCKSLKAVSLPDALEDIEGYCFLECSNLASITIPSKVKVLNESTFRDCNALTSVSLPVNMKEIRSGSFENCVKLKEITLPRNLIFFDLSCFEGCTSLRTVNLPTGFVPETRDGSLTHSVTLYVPRNSKTDYEDNETYMTFFDIAEKDFDECTYMIKVNNGAFDYGWLYVDGRTEEDRFSNEFERVEFRVDKGSNPIIEIEPDEHYLMKYTVLHNGVNVTNQIEDNVYTIKNVQGNSDIEIFWEEGTPNGYHLITARVPDGDGEIIVNGENSPEWTDEEGNSLFKVKRGDDVTITLESYYYELAIFTLLVNGVDVSSEVKNGVYTIRNVQEDLQLEAWFEESLPTGIGENNVKGSEIPLHTLEGQCVSTPRKGYVYVRRGKKIKY